MSLLMVHNGFKAELPGLGKNKRISELGEKRVTKAIREKLRLEYGLFNVTVSCRADFYDKTWHGKCTIYDIGYEYLIKKNP